MEQAVQRGPHEAPLLRLVGCRGLHVTTFLTCHPERSDPALRESASRRIYVFASLLRYAVSIIISFILTAQAISKLPNYSITNHTMAK